MISQLLKLTVEVAILISVNVASLLILVPAITEVKLELSVKVYESLIINTTFI